MNEIEKMYENVGIKPYKRKYGIYLSLPWGLCEYTQKVDGEYPPFTADKQLELIDWFIKNEDDVRIEFDCDDELYYFETVQDKEKTIGKSLAEALANLINIYFENFTDTEIEEVKEILEN